MSQLGYTWYPKDYISDPDVMMMDCGQRGIYRDLIDLAYMNDNNINYSLEKLARYTGATVEQVQEILDLKGKKKGEYWTIPNCQRRIDLVNKNRKNGQKGGRKRNRKNPDGNPKLTQMVTQKEPKANPDGNPINGNGLTQTARQIEIESKIEIEKEREVVEAAPQINDSKQLADEVYRQGLKSDTWENRNSISELYDIFSKSPSFKKQWALMGEKVQNENPIHVLHDWIQKGPWHEVSNGKIHKATGWIQRYKPTPSPSTSEMPWT